MEEVAHSRPSHLGLVNAWSTLKTGTSTGADSPYDLRQWNNWAKHVKQCFSDFGHWAVPGSDQREKENKWGTSQLPPFLPRLSFQPAVQGGGPAGSWWSLWAEDTELEVQGGQIAWNSQERERERESAVQRETSGNHRASSLISCMLMSTYMWRNDLTPGKELPKGTEGNIFRDHTDLGMACTPTSYRKQQRHLPPPITS